MKVMALSSPAVEATVGTVFRSTAAEPRPTVPLVFSVAAGWARTLLISTST
jgi:hypothetical protein